MLLARKIVKMRIFVIGFMGSGKTTWGRMIAEKMGMIFYDLDDMIEKRVNLKINNIFEKKGESYFRKIEAVALRELYVQDNFVLACGGGTPCYYDNMSFINSQGVSVWMNTPKQVMATRLLEEAENRPLIRNLSPTKLQELIDDKLEERLQYYNQAQLVIDPSEVTIDDLILQLQQHA
jgi:shikimate kinase